MCGNFLLNASVKRRGSKSVRVFNLGGLGWGILFYIGFNATVALEPLTRVEMDCEPGFGNSMEFAGICAESGELAGLNDLSSNWLGSGGLCDHCIGSSIILYSYHPETLPILPTNYTRVVFQSLYAARDIPIPLQ